MTHKLSWGEFRRKSSRELIKECPLIVVVDGEEMFTVGMVQVEGQAKVKERVRSQIDTHRKIGEVTHKQIDTQANRREQDDPQSEYVIVGGVRLKKA